MGRTKSRGQRKSQDKLLQKGLEALVVGVGLLFAPALMGNSPMTRALAGPLGSFASLALLIGSALIAAHFIMRHVARQNTPAIYRPDSTSCAPPETLARREPGFADAVVPISAARARRSAASLAPIAQAAPVAQERRPQTAWSAKVFEGIEWRRFEAVCEKLFAQGGFETRSQSHGADGGVDIWLHSKNSQGPAAVVQCKHWSGKPVGVKEMREFFGVMASHQLKRGTYATTTDFTADALKFAKDNGINAMNSDRLLALIASRTPEQQRELLEVAYEGEYWRPTCASCGAKMVQRQRGKDGATFWGCVDYPRCHSTLPMRRAAG
jgi:restriction system protein